MTTLTTAHAAVRHVQSLLATTPPRRIALLSSRVMQARLCEAALQEHLPLSARAHEVQNFTPTSFAAAVAENAQITLPAARVNETAYAALLRQALTTNTLGLEAPFMRPPHDPLRHLDAIHQHFEALASRGVTPAQYLDWIASQPSLEPLAAEVHGGLARGYGFMWSRVFTGRAMSHGWLAFTLHSALAGSTPSPPLNVSHIVASDAHALHGGSLKLLQAAVARTAAATHGSVAVALFCDAPLRAEVPREWAVHTTQDLEAAVSPPVHALLQRFNLAQPAPDAASDTASNVASVSSTSSAPVDLNGLPAPTVLHNATAADIHALGTPHGACIYSHTPIDALVQVVKSVAAKHGPTHVLIICRNARAARQAAVQLESHTAGDDSIRVTLNTRAALRNVPSVRVALCAAAIAGGLHTDAHAHTLITSSVYGLHPHAAAQVMQAVKHSRDGPQPFLDRLQRIADRSISPPDADVIPIIDAFMSDMNQLSAVWRRSGTLTRVCEAFIKSHESKLEEPDALAQLLSILHDIEMRATLGGVAQVWEVLDEALRDTSVHSEDVDDLPHTPLADASSDVYGLLQLSHALSANDTNMRSDGIHAYPYTHVHVGTHTSSLPRAHTVVLFEPAMPGTAAAGSRIPACDALYPRDDPFSGKRALWAHALTRASHNVVAITPPHALTRRARFLDETFGKPPSGSSKARAATAAATDTCVLTPFPPSPLPHMSVSRMQQYMSCGWAYQLHRNTGIRAHTDSERQTLMYGTGMHACVAILGSALAHSFTQPSADAAALDTLCAALVQSYARDSVPAVPDEVSMSRNARFEALQAYGDMAAAFARAGAALHTHVHILTADERDATVQRVCSRLRSVEGHMMDAFTLACMREESQALTGFPVGAAHRIMRPAGVTPAQWDDMCAHARAHVSAAIRRECERVTTGMAAGVHTLSIPVLIEHAFEVQTPAGTLLRGVWDRVDVTASLNAGMRVCIREFKSGSHTHAPTHMQTHGKVYARVQMHTYAAALTKWMAAHVPALAYDGSVALESIETGESVLVAVDARAQERAWTRLEETAASIQAGVFTPRPSRQICSSCEYNDTCAYAWGVDSTAAAAAASLQQA